MVSLFSKLLGRCWRQALSWTYPCQALAMLNHLVECHFDPVNIA